MALTTEWWVYVIQSQAPRFNKKGQRLPGFYYVGSTTDHRRRLREHNGELKGGGKYTSQHRPWVPAALYGPYGSRSEAFKAEMALKHGKRAVGRTQWSVQDSPYCRGLGAKDPWVTEQPVKPSGPAQFQGEAPQEPPPTITPRRRPYWARRRNPRPT